MVTTAQTHSTPQIAQHDWVLDLLESVAFEVTLGADILWAHTQAAHVKLGKTLPQTVSQLIDYFETLSPRLSSNALKAYLPGAQGIWQGARRLKNGEAQHFELRLERTQEPDHFIGVIRDVTSATLQAAAQDDKFERHAALGALGPKMFNARRDMLTHMASSYCPRAVQLNFTLRGAAKMLDLYGPVIIDHIQYELLRRITAYLPDETSVCLDEQRLMVLLPDIQTLDAESLSQSLIAFPISTPQGSVNVALDIETELLISQTGKRAKEPTHKVRSEKPPEITANDILALLNQRRLSLALQPICDAKTGAVHHYEALMRVDDPDKGPISAWRHILAAEKLDLVHLMDMRALERATLLMIRYPVIHLALNISAATICHESYQADYLDLLDAHPSLHARLTFEMTETMALDNPNMAAQFSNLLHQRGCYLSIDDFGTGHTSFKTLMTTEAAQIKLDGSLISNICRSQEQQNFVRLMVDFADTFEAKLVVERVETRKEQLLLAALGVDYLQGYYLGKPVSEYDFKTLKTASG